MKYNIISPDDITICYDDFDTIEEAWEYFDNWINGFKQQGYYSTVRNSQRIHIPLDEVKNYCVLIEVKEQPLDEGH